MRERVAGKEMGGGGGERKREYGERRERERDEGRETESIGRKVEKERVVIKAERGGE